VKSFSGFRPGQENQVALPESFFVELLPLIDDLNELKVTLACWRALALQSGDVRWVRPQDLQADGALADLNQAAVQDGLERAVARGTLLRVQAPNQAGNQAWYFANTEAGRAAVTAIQKGELPKELALTQTNAAPAERPNIFALYEQTIGLLSPLLADELRDAEQSYPAEWIQDAFREAARQNVRSWAYVRKILERRSQRGKRTPRDSNVSEEWRRVIRGES
jgi:DnaD/phage-associated family protein